MQVKQIMARKVISVLSSESIIEVAHLLDKHSIHGVPVINKENELVGVITESDFFIKGDPGLHLPSYLDFLKKAQFAKRLSKKQKEQTGRLLKATAGDIMTKECFCVDEEMEVKELVKIFKSRHFYIIPVVNKKQKVAGVVTMADIIKLI